MARSLGFGSTAFDSSPVSDSVSLRLRTSMPLTSPNTVTRRLILQKARHHPPSEALTACKSTVSGSLSLPSRGPFHLSLTVLCAIGSCRVFSLGGWSPLIPTGFLVSRRTQVPQPCSPKCFAYEAFTLFGGPSQFPSATFRFVNCTGLAPLRPYNPILLRVRFGLLPLRSPLLGESLLISFPAGTQMVHFPASRLIILSIHIMIHDSYHVGYPIRRSADLRVLAPPRSFSQLVTSFFASQLPGILRGPFLA